MKFLAGTAVAILLSASPVLSQPAAGRGPQGPRVASPEICADKTVTFRLLAPKAEAVVLNGSWDGGNNVAMTKDGQGTLPTDSHPGVEEWRACTPQVFLALSVSGAGAMPDSDMQAEPGASGKM